MDRKAEMMARYWIQVTAMAGLLRIIYSCNVSCGAASRDPSPRRSTEDISSSWGVGPLQRQYRWKVHTTTG